MTLELALVNLASWSLQVAALALAAAAAARWLPIGRPAARLAFAQALLAAVLLLPLVQPWRAAAAGLVTATTAAQRAAPRPADASGSPLGLPAWPGLLAGVLASGALVQLGRLAFGLARLQRLRRRAIAFEAPPRLDALRRALAPRASLALSDEAASPAAFGLLRPTVLLPPAFPRLDRDQQQAILLHELLHVRRGDWAVQLAEELLRAALFFHPAVHWLLARVRLAREQTVDAEAVRRLGERDAYLRALVEVARAASFSRAVPAAPFLQESHLRERVDQLLEEGLVSRTRTILQVAATAAAVILAVSWTAAAVPLQAAKPAAGPSVNVADDVTERDIKIVEKVNPAYPADAKAEKVEGVFVIDVVIGRDGAIRDAQVAVSAPTLERMKELQVRKGTQAALEGDTRLAEAALAAVRQWKYQPIVRGASPSRRRPPSPSASGSPEPTPGAPADRSRRAAPTPPRRASGLRRQCAAADETGPRQPTAWPFSAESSERTSTTYISCR
jgi:hypothetical protein